jgi:Putative transposase, YhgA-like
VPDSPPTGAPPAPHDALFKASFAQPDVARSELDLVLPPSVRAHLNLETLVECSGTFIDRSLQHLQADLLFSLRTVHGGEALVYVLFEHQSSFDPTMPFRLLRYMIRIWEDWQKRHPGAPTLPVILPLVMHHGDTAWSAAPELASVLDADPAMLDATRPFVPHFRFILDDLAALSVETLATRAISSAPRLVQLALWASRSLPRLLSAAPFMHQIMRVLIRDRRMPDLVVQFHRYVLSTAPRDVDTQVIRTILLEIAGPEGREDVMNAGEQLRQEGELRGEQKGLRTAITAVMSARQLSLSETGRSRLASCADVATLMRWLARASNATTEAEVFAGDDVA